MIPSTIAILSPGDMGHSMGQRLHENGLRVIACLEGRSERTRSLAQEAGIESVASYDELVQQADILLSILVPAQAMRAAEQVALALERTGADLIYTDCNAIAPQTARAIGERITAAGGRFMDGGIIGGPPRGNSNNRLYVAGPDCDALLTLNEYGLKVIALDGPPGQASALKMCYAALTKGFTALCTTQLTAAERLGVSEPLMAELTGGQSAIYDRMTRSIPGMTPRAHRWVGEMLEIASTFEYVGLSPHFHLGAAEIYRLVAESPLAERTPESEGPPPSLEEVIRILAEQVEASQE